MPKAIVDILIKGYNHEGDGHDNYTCTCTLVRDGDILIVVDPGSSPKGILGKALADRKLNYSDIDYVFVTHYHPDHARDIALFYNAKLVDVWAINDGDQYDWIRYNHKLTPNTKVIRTPGHAREHASLLVDTAEGKVVVAGDVWWYEDFTPVKDPYAVDQKQLEKSREKVLKLADYIIPGHGGMKKVEKSK